VDKEQILESDLAENVVSSILEATLKKYKIDPVEGYSIVMDTIDKNPKFLQLLEKNPSLKDIQKTHLYNEVKHKAKHTVYYRLRQYNSDLETQKSLIADLEALDLHEPKEEEYGPIIKELAQTHTSTRERLNHNPDFYEKVFQVTGVPTSILDVGCGLNPVLFPWSKADGHLRSYVGLDKDLSCISALSAFAPLVPGKILFPVRWNIRENWETARLKTGIRPFHFDVAFFMKLIPVISRIEDELSNILLAAPADTWVITGSITAMTTYRNIERREQRVVRQFIEKSKKSVIAEFSMADEFCKILK